MPRVRFLVVALVLLAPCFAQAETRIALVIGNSTYSSGPLPNPANDAKLIASSLQGLGFELITRINADQVTMKRAIQEFGARLEKAGPDSVGLFYYAGHGVQLNGRNYLIPTTANIEREGDVEIEAVSADWVLEQMRYARNRLNLVILDACRNNPFTRGMRGIDHGLATMDAPAGILIAYSTAPGEVAQDGNGRNSPYTEALTNAMRQLHEPVEQVFKHVRVGVMTATSGKQVPWESSSLTGDFYFAGQPSAPAPPRIQVAAAPGTQSPALPPKTQQVDPAPTIAPTPADEKPGSGGFSAWLAGLFSSKSDSGGGPADTPGAGGATAAASGSAGAPGAATGKAAAPGTATVASGRAGSSTTLAMNGRPGSGFGSGGSSSGARNSGAGSSASDASGEILQGTRALALLSSLGIQTAAIDPKRNYPQAAIRRLIEDTPRRVTLGSTPEQIRSAFALCQQYSRDCQIAWYADESMRQVTLDPFDLDEVPVSVRAFRQFAEGAHYRTQAEKAGFAYAVVNGSLQPVTGGSWRNAIKKHDVEDDSPVIGVSFQDAQVYCRSKGGRLPSEDEWEYAARGPTRSIFPWGDDATPVARAMAIPPHVTDGPAEGIGGRYKGMSGNVWQWVNTKVGARKVLKGGSWLESNPANKRAATRRYEVPNRADEDSGFRCARSVPTWPDANIWMSRIK